ncbi:5-formyltetrahydrofolate cyclo-ligase [Loigolactobacillus jiayinensis]|uniref:5-formyltetrahydrofolate cyclo-ligase n=1 Tax=Loigolactobacillus jiayinensis TaxID=2486016 RepID=A0ABW1RDJ2_9LACO|nr:5-formyltetrahydrofolate cyclo-ligase [Loigolactobacillus jiayinensis]
MEKAALRQTLIKQLATLPTKQQEEAQLQQQLFALPQWQQANTVAVTLSQALEVNTQPIITAALATGKTVYVPKVMPKRQLAFLPYTPNVPLVKSKFGLQEPVFQADRVATEFDLLLVPGLAFTAAGQRLGFGGGYYDRFLVQHPQATVSLALTPQFYATADWPVEPFDILIDHVITVKQVNTCNDN